MPEPPFWFKVTRPVPLLGPETFAPVGWVGTDGEYRAVEVSGAWVLAEDHFGRRGWVPSSVIHKRVRRQKVVGARKAL